MSELSKLLQDTNDNIVKGWAFRADKDESFQLLKLDAIVTEDGTEDQLVATIYDMGDFLQFIAEQSPPQEGKTE